MLGSGDRPKKYIGSGNWKMMEIFRSHVTILSLSLFPTQIKWDIFGLIKHMCWLSRVQKALECFQLPLKILAL